MNHTHQSKQTSTSDLWFQKNNYMSQFLSDKSIEIINKINKKYGNANR
jgi:predicted transcriptional regulator